MQVLGLQSLLSPNDSTLLHLNVGAFFIGIDYSVQMMLQYTMSDSYVNNLTLYFSTKNMSKRAFGNFDY